VILLDKCTFLLAICHIDVLPTQSVPIASGLAVTSILSKCQFFLRWLHDRDSE
jgi:hypothetical protein